MLPQIRKCPMPNFVSIGPPIGVPERFYVKKRTYDALKENGAIMLRRRYIYGISSMKIGPLFFIKVDGQNFQKKLF